MASRPDFDLPDLSKVALENYSVTLDQKFDGIWTHGASSIIQDSERREFSLRNDNEVFLQKMMTSPPPGFVEDLSTITKRADLPATLALKKEDDFNLWTSFKSALDFAPVKSTFEEKKLDSSRTKNGGPNPGTIMKMNPFEDYFDLNNNNMTFSAQDIVIDSLYPDHMEGTQMIYVIKAAPGKILPQIGFFKVKIREPAGWITPLKLQADQDKQGSYVCSFVPSTIGHHLISVTLTMDGISCNIKSSFLEVQVSRNYFRVNRRSIIKGQQHQPKFLSKPWGVAVLRPMNWIYLADREANKIFMLDDKGNVLESFGQLGHEPGQFNKPTGIAVDGVNRRLVITDKDNHRISIHSLDGSFLKCFGSSGYEDGQFKYPWGVAVSPDGETIAVADSKNYRIQLFDKDGQFLRKFTLIQLMPYEFKKYFHSPRGITFDHEGQNMYVTDFELDSIFKINLDCTEKTTILGPVQLRRPQGITMDAAGNLLVANTKHNCVKVISLASGQTLALKGTGNVPFKGPFDVAVLNGGKIAAVDESGVFRIF